MGWAGKGRADALDTRICELEVAAATSDRELSIFVRVVRSLTSRTAAGKERANLAKNRACKPLYRISKLRELLEGLNQNVGDERAHVARLFDVELICIQAVITAALSDSEVTVSEAVCHMRNSFPIEASSGAPGPSATFSSNEA